MKRTELQEALKARSELPASFEIAPNLTLVNSPYDFKYGYISGYASLLIRVPLASDPKFATTITDEQVAVIRESVAKMIAWDNDELDQDELIAYAQSRKNTVEAMEKAAKEAAKPVVVETAAERVDNEPFQS